MRLKQHEFSKLLHPCQACRMGDSPPTKPPSPAVWPTTSEGPANSEVPVSTAASTVPVAVLMKKVPNHPGSYSMKSYVCFGLCFGLTFPGCCDVLTLIRFNMFNSYFCWDLEG